MLITNSGGQNVTARLIDDEGQVDPHAPADGHHGTAAATDAGPPPGVWGRTNATRSAGSISESCSRAWARRACSNPRARSRARSCSTSRCATASPAGRAHERPRDARPRLGCPRNGMQPTQRRPSRSTRSRRVRTQRGPVLRLVVLRPVPIGQGRRSRLPGPPERPEPRPRPTPLRARQRRPGAVFHLLPEVAKLPASLCALPGCFAPAGAPDDTNLLAAERLAELPSKGLMARYRIRAELCVTCSATDRRQRWSEGHLVAADLQVLAPARLGHAERKLVAKRLQPCLAHRRVRALSEVEQDDDLGDQAACAFVEGEPAGGG